MVIDQERFKTAQPVDHRRRDRRDCYLQAHIATHHGESGARIINISAGGVGFTIDPMLGLKPGERVMLRQALLGEVRCVVRWGMHPRYGAEFEPAGRTPPGARALYDSLGPGPESAG
jgi:PilZ domain